MNTFLAKEWLRLNDITRRELAKRMGIDPSTLWRHLSGKYKLNKRFILSLSHITGIPESELSKPCKKVRKAP